MDCNSVTRCRERREQYQSRIFNEKVSHIIDIINFFFFVHIINISIKQINPLKH